ncbi:hypothetical protein EDB19DRAFT_195868 [Suillus lakei]|nr:hypothetical protein EDB19DRAFT_195868 [Suillus lakei]
MSATPDNCPTAAFRAVAPSSKYLKARSKEMTLCCSQCKMRMEKPRKCSKCKSVWYCSEKCQKKDWPTHKPTCHEVERSPEKFIRMFTVNPLLMGYLEVAIALDCGLLDNPRVGIDEPFIARVDMAIEPSNMRDFIGLYSNVKGAVGKKVQGMLQVNFISPWNPSMKGVETPAPARFHQWRKARARIDAEGFAKSPVGIIDFVDANCAEFGNTISVDVHIPTTVLDMARKREPFERIFAITFAKSQQPMSAMACLEYINVHIRSDTQNQLRLRTEMTEQEKEVVRAAGRNEDTLTACILNQKMNRELMYADIV